jgi:hypothetical protein
MPAKRKRPDGYPREKPKNPRDVVRAAFVLRRRQITREPRCVNGCFADFFVTESAQEPTCRSGLADFLPQKGERIRKIEENVAKILLLSESLVRL